MTHTPPAPPPIFSEPLRTSVERPPDRAATLAAIESGALDHIDFDATVYQHVKNRKHFTFRTEDLAGFAASFAGQPFLRDHNTWEIDARDGTILASKLDGDRFVQTVRLTTRKGMTAFVEGQIDRFSIQWDWDEMLCTICNSPWFTCAHVPGRKYNGQLCELLFTQPRGKETSAVNSPEIKSTGLLSDLETYRKDYQTMFHLKPLFVFDDDGAPGGAAPNPPTPPAPAETPQAAPDQLHALLTANQKAMATLLGETEQQRQLDEQLKLSNAILAEQCGFLLTTALSASRLPEITQTRIRKAFEGRVFQAAELQSAIDEAREEVSTLTAPGAVQGIARVSGMFNSDDQLQAAVDDLLGAPRDPDKATLKTARLSGIRELYIGLTGDRDFYGGIYPLQALFSSTTATFPVLVKNALNKALVKAWEKYGLAGYDWWKKIATVEHFDSLQQITWMIVGTIASLPAVAESADYTELKFGDNGEISNWDKYGGYVGITLEAIDRDDTRKLRAAPNEVALAAIRNISEKVAALFTVNSGAGPVLSDTGNLFNATVQTTQGGHANLLTAALAADGVAWNAVRSAIYNQPMHVANEAGKYGTGKKQAIYPRFCLVPEALRATADQLFKAQRLASGADNLLFNSAEPITVPEWTDVDNWAAAADPAILPGVMLGERFGEIPQIFIAGNETDPAVFMNDESRIKVRHFLALGLGNWRALHKNNVAT